MWILPGRGIETRDGEQVAGQDHGVGAPWLPTREREREGGDGRGAATVPAYRVGVAARVHGVGCKREEEGVAARVRPAP